LATDRLSLTGSSCSFGSTVIVLEWDRRQRCHTIANGSRRPRIAATTTQTRRTSGISVEAAREAAAREAAGHGDQGAEREQHREVGGETR